MRHVTENNKPINPPRTQTSLQPNKARIRCPYCFQIFQTFREEFTDERPDFECSSCFKQFWIEAKSSAPVILGQPVGQEPNRVPTHKLGVTTKICPRCTEEVPLKDQECRFCGVVFIKMIEGAQATFQLRGVWAQVIKYWHDDTKHDNFLRACHKQKELIYGISCYGRILKEDKDNKKAKEMIKRMEALTWFFKEDNPPRPLILSTTFNKMKVWMTSHAFDALMLALVLCLFLYIFL